VEADEGEQAVAIHLRIPGGNCVTAAPHICVVTRGVRWWTIAGTRSDHMDWYLPLKLVHIASAVVAVGANVTYFVWLAAMRGRSQPAQSFALETISKLDRRLANPAYTILPTTGVIMVLISPLGFTTFWIAVAIGLFVLLGLFGGLLFTPALRRLAAIVDTEGPEAAGYGEAVRRVNGRGLVTMLPVAGILYLMVFKPSP
jgi:uncharacterized membrane protein